MGGELTLGEKIKDFGDRKYESVAEYARMLDTDRTKLYGYFNNKVLPGAEFLIKLKSLGCDMNWLLTPDGKDNFGPNDGWIEHVQREGILFNDLAELRKEIGKLQDKLDEINSISKH